MSDGAVLVSDHYYPSNPGPNPTILMRQPYGRDIASTVVYAHPIWFASHGYNVVIQDVRGRGDSEGVFYPFRHEARDGFDTIAALRQRPESNGKFGMYGFSYQGSTQWLVAAEQPEGLLCIAPAQTAHDLYRGWFYQNGALRLASTIGWGFQMLKEDTRRLGLHEASAMLERAWANLAAHFLETPYGRHPILQQPGLPTYLNDWIEHDQPGPYWEALDISTRMDRINIPALHISGWYDTYLSGSINGFLAACAESPARDQQYLVAGPWVHIPWGQRIGPQDFGPAANLDTDDLHLRWFNHWLKDSGEFASEPHIRHFVLNQNQWHSTEPLNSKLETSGFLTPEFGLSLNLHSQGRANSSRGDGTLTPAPHEPNENPDTYVYDPEVPVTAPGGFASAAGPTSQTLLEQGNNVLVYTTAPMTEAIHVFGSPVLTLSVQTSSPYADFVAKLILLKPSGEAMFLSLGIVRSQHTPDTPHTLQIPLDVTSCVFSAGDRIRLEVASCAYPLFDRNPSTAIPPRLASPWNWGRSTQIVHHTPTHPSTLHLPLAGTKESIS
jgi:putative CocE/NonD family hydrolase